MIIRNPFAQPLSFVGLEIVVLACAAITLLHALRAWRDRRELLPLFTWVAVLSYGVAMEIVSYSTVDNFTHGPFTVMLYRGRLPLYIVGVYPVLLYTGIAATRRLGLSRWAEPLVAGLAIVLLDVPFDVLGPDAGWWSWSSTDPNLRERALGVPFVSYYWHITFGACLALLTRSVDRWLTPAKARLAALAVAPLLGVCTIALGGLSFVPFHVLRKAGVSDAANLALLVTACLAILAFARKGPPAATDRLLLAVPVAYHLFFVAVLLSRRGDSDAADKAVVIVLATACSLAFQGSVQRSGEGIWQIRRTRST
jgi:hypothetical protein